MQTAVSIISVSRSIYNKLSFHCHVIFPKQSYSLFTIHFHVLCCSVNGFVCFVCYMFVYSVCEPNNSHYV